MKGKYGAFCFLMAASWAAEVWCGGSAWPSVGIKGTVGKSAASWLHNQVAWLFYVELQLEQFYLRCAEVNFWPGLLSLDSVFPSDMYFARVNGGALLCFWGYLPELGSSQAVTMTGKLPSFVLFLYSSDVFFKFLIVFRKNKSSRHWRWKMVFVNFKKIKHFPSVFTDESYFILVYTCKFLCWQLQSWDPSWCSVVACFVAALCCAWCYALPLVNWKGMWLSIWVAGGMCEADGTSSCCIWLFSLWSSASRLSPCLFLWWWSSVSRQTVDVH